MAPGRQRKFHAPSAARKLLVTPTPLWSLLCALLKFISINIIAAISWPPPLISQLFSPRLFKAAPFFHSLAVFCVDKII